MEHRIKILHLEDLPSDAELIAMELKRGRIDAEICVVPDKVKFIKALNDFSYDVILSDHSLASFDSHEALTLVKEADINVPFILVTSSMTDEFAVKMMKEGAHDYILKDRLQRLPLAIINSIEKYSLEKKQEASRGQLAFHIENTPLGLIEWDNQFHIKALSKQAEDIFGWNIEEFSENERNGYSLVYFEDLPTVNKVILDLKTGAVERNTLQHRNITKNGRVIWCEWFNSVLRDKDGKVVTIMSLVQDITERKTFAEKLEYNESRLKEAQAVAHIGNFEIGLANYSEAWSDEMFKLCGIKKDEFAPSTELFLSFIHPDDLNYIQKGFKQCVEKSQDSSFNFRFIRKDGILRYGYSEARFEFDKNQKPIRLFGIFQDVTENKLAEIERTKMVNDLLLRNNDLEQFAYIISHNLRAPVANIIGASSALNDPELSTDDKEMLNKGINESVTRLDVVVKDLNRILEVKSEINNTKEMVHFSELVDDIKISLQNLIDKEKIEIKYDFSEIDELLTLKPYIYSVFYNLISNSVKYRQQHLDSIIKIKSRRVENQVELIFTDNGMGIDLNKRGDQVFGLYKRFHTNIEGKGMGLFMVKVQVEALGGRISINSIENKGTEFNIILNC